jgi:pimeloyl-ACP methyl ester carboxylesterase
VAELVARETAPGFGAAERRAVFEEMLTTAKPATRRQVIASLDRIDSPAFGLLRKALFELVDGPQRLAAYHGPAVAIEEGDEPWPGGAAAVLQLARVAVHDTCHWIQLDQPEAVSRAVDEFLEKVGKGK